MREPNSRTTAGCSMMDMMAMSRGVALLTALALSVAVPMMDSIVEVRYDNAETDKHGIFYRRQAGTYIQNDCLAVRNAEIDCADVLSDKCLTVKIFSVATPIFGTAALLVMLYFAFAPPANEGPPIIVFFSQVLEVSAVFSLIFAAAMSISNGSILAHLYAGPEADNDTCTYNAKGMDFKFGEAFIMLWTAATLYMLLAVHAVFVTFISSPQYAPVKGSLNI